MAKGEGRVVRDLFERAKIQKLNQNWYNQVLLIVVG